MAPVATVILVLVTLLGALPVYAQVAGRSYAGQGSIAMLENLLSGWKGKIFVLVLLGFAATDFVITMTLSAADAAKHAIENPYLHRVLGEHEISSRSQSWSCWRRCSCGGSARRSGWPQRRPCRTSL